MTARSDQPAGVARVPRPLAAVLTIGGAAAVIAVSARLATTKGAERAQTGLVKWFNHPPQPVAAVFALVNPLCRPLPLTLMSVAFIAWVLLTAGRVSVRLKSCGQSWSRWLAELMAQVGKLLANQPRPLAVIDGLDTHGYPVEPTATPTPRRTRLCWSPRCARCGHGCDGRNASLVLPLPAGGVQPDLYRCPLARRCRRGLAIGIRRAP
jgi:hypothetical protein